MASVRFVLHQPFKKSQKKDKAEAKAENAMISAEVKDRKKQGKDLKSLFNPEETSIYLFFTRDRFHRFRIKTDLKVKPIDWNFTKQEYKAKSGSIEQNRKLNNLKHNTLELYNKLTTDEPEISFAKVEKNIRTANLKRFVPTNSKSDLNKYMSQYIEDMKSGKRLTKKGTKYKEGTIAIYEAMQVKFNNFQKRKNKQYNFDHIDLDFYHDFIGFLIKENLAPNTIGRHTKYLLAVLRKARREGLHKNLEIEDDDFMILKEESFSIYLTEDELQRMFELDLSNNKTLEKTRDVFIVGARTAQRYGDYSIIGLENIRVIGNNIRIISLFQEKTTAYVDIPIHPQAKTILEKYNYELPKIHDQKLNERIKKVGEKAKIDSDVIIEKTKGGVRTKKTFKKHQLITSHTARRTGATLMYLAGIPTFDIMKITGHTTERELLRYIKVTKEETAQSLSNHKYFQ